MTTSYKNRYCNRGILDDEEINAGGLVARDLAISLWMLADDQGRLTAAVKWIWHQVFQHLEEVSLARCKKAFEHLDAAAHYILLYEHDGKTYLQIRNWHKFQPQKVDRVRWSSLPAHPGWDPSIHLPKRLYEQWLADEKKPGFSPPPISNHWISGGRLEPFRFRHVSGDGDEPEDERSQNVSASGTLPARAPVDEWKSGKSGRSGRSTRGDKDSVGEPPPDPTTTTPPSPPANGHAASPTAPPHPLDWSDWETLTVGQRQLRLTNWLWYGKRHWSSVKAATREHEAGIAFHIANLTLDGPTIINHLEAWWSEADPDDQPSSLEYFWTRFQQLESDGLKTTRRPHARTEGLSRISPGLPVIQPSEPSQEAKS